MIEFKIGDKVVIHKRGDISCWNKIMLEHADGKIGVITSIGITNSYRVSTGDEYLVHEKPMNCIKYGWNYKADNLEHYSLIPEDLFTL